MPFPFPFTSFSVPEPFAIFGEWFAAQWWLWLFLALLILGVQLWKAYIQECYKKVTNPWTILELHFPREVKQSPHAMEQVFSQLHAIRNSASDFEEKWWDGEVPLWFSFEAVSFGGEIHIYLFIPAVRRKHIEAAFYAAYPDIEFTEVQEDYIHRLPPTASELYRQGYRMFGNELIFSKDPVYPIRTYLDFEAPVEEKEVDPVADLLETLTSIRPEEHLWMQILVRPKVDSFIDQFRKRGDDEINRIKERGRFARGAAGQVVIDPNTGLPVYTIPAPGEVEAMRSIGRKIGKPAFDVVIRYIYLAPQEIFSSSFGRRSIFAVMNQYATEDYNKFGHNVHAWTLAKLWYSPYIFPNRRAAARRQWLWEKYRRREMYPESAVSTVLKIKLFHWGFRPRSYLGPGRFNLILNTEELATVFHPPTTLVLTGPLIKRVEARKVGPPAGLPIYGEGEEPLPGIEPGIGKKE